VEPTTPSWKGVLNDAITLLFAGFWAWRGTQAAQISPEIASALILAITLILLGLFLRRDLILNRPETIHNRPLAKRTKIGRIIAIYTAVAATIHFHRPDLQLPLIGLVIGASYIPLGSAMREPVHYGIGIVIITVTLASFPLPPPYHIELAGFGTALATWTGCLLRLWHANSPMMPLLSKTP